VYVFGGRETTSDTFSTSMLQFNAGNTNHLMLKKIETGQCKNILPSNNEIHEIPSLRYHHVAFLHNGEIYIHGGKYHTHVNDIFAFSIQTNHWRSIDVLNKSISRYGHTAAVHNDVVYMFGGFDSNGFASNDLLRFDLKLSQWLPTVKKTRQWPEPRYHHSATLHRNHMYAFGGVNNTFTALNDMYCFDLEAISYGGEMQCWKVVTENDPSPSRYGHCAYQIDDEIHILGGTSYLEEIFPIVDSWVFSIAYKTWNHIRCVDLVNYPTSVFTTVILTEKSGLFVYGGRNVVSESVPTVQLDIFDISLLSDDVLLHILEYFTATERTLIRLANKQLRISQLTLGNC
jgi:hypothetical protein